MFTWKTTIRLYDTDAAGRIFFASLLRIAHDAFEAFMSDIGQPITRFLRGDEGHLVIVHAEADYRHPINCGDALDVLVGVGRVGNTSFVMSYQFHRNGEEVGTARTVHVALDKDGAKRAIPDDLRRALAK